VLEAHLPLDTTGTITRQSQWLVWLGKTQDWLGGVALIKKGTWDWPGVTSIVAGYVLRLV